MPPSQPPSDIQVFVRWKEQTIFAGEDVECIITFKNVAPVESEPNGSTGHSRKAAGPSKPQPHTSARGARLSPMNGVTNGGRTTAAQTLSAYTSAPRRPTPLSSQQSPSDLLHNPQSRRPSLVRSQHSFTFPPRVFEEGVAKNGQSSRPATAIPSSGGHGHRHQKSISIISFDSERGSAGAPLQHQTRGHHRSRSLQAPPPRRGSTAGVNQDTGYPSPRAYRSPSLISNTNPSVSNTNSQRLPIRPHSQHKSISPSSAAQPKPFIATEFKAATTLSPVEAPGDSPVVGALSTSPNTNPPLTPNSNNDENPSYAPSLPSIVSPTGSARDQLSRQRSRAPSLLDSNASASRFAPLSRIFSDTTGISVGSGSNASGSVVGGSGGGGGGGGRTGSARSSADFYSVSNLSSETLESEYTQYTTGRNLLSSNGSMTTHSRGPSMSTSASMDIPGRSRTQKTQTLLMGYAQISGTFSVDGSLVDQAQFEKVKRSGVMGTQVNGAAKKAQEKQQRGGFWGSFGLGKIEESLSGLLGNGELDGLREMRGVTSSSSIPLLSTPQSLLFVDLHLHPGEEKSFSFTFSLPRGLPASHKGKAIKISYNLIIGTQRPSNGKEVQKMNKISIPFRVLTGVDEDGEILGHDLTRPYVLRGDEARVEVIEKEDLPTARPVHKSIGGRRWTGAPDFLNYVDEILQDVARDSRQESYAATSPSLLSPSASSQTLRPFPSATRPAHYSCKDAIDFAIMQSNRISTMSGQQHPHPHKSPNRFEITRGGRRIAVIVLNRPAHRLGETIVATVDFTGAALPCYSLYGALETSEKINPMIALRSSTSISRATRRIYGTCSENTLYAHQVSFTPSIPVSATPTLVTSSITLAWELRFEFVTSGVHDEIDVGPTGVYLLEAVEKNDRHTIMASMEYLPCDSFEVTIPLTVYGESTREPATEEIQGYQI